MTETQGPAAKKPKPDEAEPGGIVVLCPPAPVPTDAARMRVRPLLSNLVVEPTFRRRGVAPRLMREAELANAPGARAAHLQPGEGRAARDGAPASGVQVGHQGDGVRAPASVLVTGFRARPAAEVVSVRRLRKSASRCG